MAEKIADTVYMDSVASKGDPYAEDTKKILRHYRIVKLTDQWGNGHFEVEEKSFWLWFRRGDACSDLADAVAHLSRYVKNELCMIPKRYSHAVVAESE